jgi:hypothetical protein
MKMNIKPGFAAIGVSIVLAGCGAHSHMLTKDSAPQLLKGEFTHGQTNRLTLESADQKYEAAGFKVETHMNWAELQRRYRGSDPKHWDRILCRPRQGPRDVFGRGHGDCQGRRRVELQAGVAVWQDPPGPVSGQGRQGIRGTF